MAQFLSPDPFIQAPGNWYNYNRYGYCFNNPLIYTDPDGEFIHLIVGAAIGGIFNWIANGAEFSWKGLGYFGVGAAAGALGAGIGSGMMAASSGSTFGAGFIGSQGAMSAIASSTLSTSTNAAIFGMSGFSSGFSRGFGNSLVNGDSFTEALGYGMAAGAYGLGGGVLTGAISSEISLWKGNKFGINMKVTTSLIGSDRIFSNIQNHMLRSAAYNIGGNVFTGNKPFKGKSFLDFIGINKSIAIPAMLDGYTYYSNRKGLPLDKYEPLARKKFIGKQLSDMTRDDCFDMPIDKVDYGGLNSYGLQPNGFFRTTLFLHGRFNMELLDYSFEFKVPYSFSQTRLNYNFLFNYSLY